MSHSCSDQDRITLVAYDNEYVYLRANGIFGAVATPLDLWAVGLKLPHPGGLVPTSSLTAFLETVAGAFSSYHADADVNASNRFHMTYLSAAVVGKDGKYVGGGAQSTLKRNYSPAIAGAGVLEHPAPTSCVISLRTTLQRGRASNGRMYWPAAALTVSGTDGRLTGTQTSSIATKAATLINSINQAADTILDGNLGVWVMSNLGDGISAPVTSVRIGSRLDHQERRENAMAEVYSSATVTPTPIVREQVERDRPIGERFTPTF